MEKRKFSWIKITLLVIIAQAVHVCGSTSWSHFEIQANKRVKDEYTYAESVSASQLHCASICARNQSCVSASYEDLSGSCDLSTLRSNGYGNDERLQDDSSWKTISRSCVYGWTVIGDGCYMLVEEEKNYTDAQEYCEQAGGKLAEPQTSATNELLKSYLLSLPGPIENYWFGLTDRNIEGKYVWNSDGLEPSYTDWLPGSNEPDNTNNADCIRFSHNEHRWGTITCKTEYRAICEL